MAYPSLRAPQRGDPPLAPEGEDDKDNLPPGVRGLLNVLDLGQRIIDIPEGLLGIGAQKALSALPGAGPGREEEVVTRAVAGQLATLPEWVRPFAAPVLYGAGASEAKRVAQRRAAEAGEIPSVETPLGRFDLLNLAEVGLPIGGLAEVGIRAAPGIARGLAARGGAITERAAATTTYRAAEAADRYRGLVRGGASTTEALDEVGRAFPTVREDEVLNAVARVVPSPGTASEAAVAAHAPRPGPGEPIPGAVGPNVGEALARAEAAKALRMRTVLDRIARGENIRADEAAEALDYLKQIDPAGAVEYDRMLGAIPMLEQGTVAGIKAARLDTRIAARAARAAARAERSAEKALRRAQEGIGTPPRAAIVGTRLATPLAAARREAAAPLAELGERLDAATEAAKTGYAHARDEQILLDASINTGKIDDPLAASQIADTIRANPEGFAEATRRVSLPETLARSADYLGVDIAELQKEIARRGFTAGENSAFLVGVQGTLARLGSELHAASGVSDVAYAAAEARFLSFARSAGGAASEAGRSLNALRLQRPMAFINAQYAQQTAKDAAKAVERAAKEVENANRAGRSAAQIARHEQTLRNAQAAYEAAVERARILGEQAQTAAIVAAERGGVGAAKRRYMATLEPDDIDSILAVLKATMKPSLGDELISVANVPRTLMATLDLSAPLRQGIVLSAAHPLSFARAFGNMVVATLSESRANRMLNELLVGPGSARRRAAGLEITDYRSGPLSAREEAFMTNALNNVPVLGFGVQASNRAYTMFLNKLRADVFDNAVAAWDRAGVAGRPNEEKGLATFINWASGRGTLPQRAGLNAAAPLLNSLFFAPRFMISRLETPIAPVVLLARGQREAAKMAAADLVKFVGAGIAVLKLAELNGAQVETDPRSASFGKIAAGPHLVDIWGGFQPNARYTAQIMSGQTKAQDTRILDMGPEFGQTTRGDVLMRYFRTKLAPLPGLGMSALIGTDPSGESMTPQGALRDTTPLGWQDVVMAGKADRDNAIRAAVVSSLALLGAGVRSDDPTAERTQVGLAKRERMESLVTTRAYQSAAPDEQKKMADRNVAEAGRLAKLKYQIGVIQNGSPSEVVPAAVEALASAGDRLRSAGVIGRVRQAGKLTPEVAAAIDAARKQTDRAKENYDPTVEEYLGMNSLGAKWLSAPEFRRGTKQEWDAAAQAASRLRDAIAAERAFGRDPSRNENIRRLYQEGAGGTLRRYYDRDGSKKSDLVSRERRDLEKDPLWPLIRSAAGRLDHPAP